MAFKTKLKVGSKEVNVLEVSYDLTQEVDPTGRPAAVTRGGRIKLKVESTGDTFFFEWMTDNFERKDGSVIFLKRDTDVKMKELEFKEGYLVKYEERFEATGTAPMVESFTISAKEIKCGSGEHVNDWV